MTNYKRRGSRRALFLAGAGSAAIVVANGASSASAASVGVQQPSSTNSSTTTDSAANKPQQTPSKSDSRTASGDIVITAQKRAARLKDVPVPVAVVSGADLAKSNLVNLQDYYTRIPGLSLQPAIQQSTILAIRGVTTSGVASNPAVGLVVDDVPFGSTTGYGGGYVLPELDPSELDRIEVLRGPQGTLYGAASLGGLFKYVMIDPSTSAFSGRFQVGAEDVKNGAELGYNFHGAVNVPIDGNLAVRASGFTRQDPGYIDNPVLGLKGVNETHVSGGRVAALWKPADNFSVKLDGFLQTTKSDGPGHVDLLPGLGDLEQSTVRGVTGDKKTFQSYSATLRYDLPGVQLTSITSYNRSHSVNRDFDLTPLLGFILPILYNENDLGIVSYSNIKTKKFNQELRADVQISPSVDWLVGLFYTHESADYLNHWLVEPRDKANVLDVALNYNDKNTYKEYAAFTDLTIRFTDKFDIQIGGRESKNKQTDQTINQSKIIGPPTPVTSPVNRYKANAFTYLLTPRLRLSPDLMVYARFASGYRPGSTNGNAGQNPNIPLQSKPDKTYDYEAGLKADFLDHHLYVDASVYYISWKDIQLSFTDPTTSAGYTANASAAKSEGVELSVDAKPWRGGTISGWFAFNDAKITKAFPPAAGGINRGAPGDRLPLVARTSGSISIDQNVPLSPDLRGFVGASVDYTGRRVNSVRTTPPPINLPAFTKVDLRAGLAYKDWQANLFLTNLFDKRGVLSGGVAPYYSFFYIQPRTFGINLVKMF
jgi:iron complex outermembrane recepter protein